MHINGCEDCHLTFAQYLPHHLKDSYDGKTYGRHICMLCGKDRFLCIGCLGTRYHYCGEKGCLTCICVECDGGAA